MDRSGTMYSTVDSMGPMQATGTTATTMNAGPTLLQDTVNQSQHNLQLATKGAGEEDSMMFLRERFNWLDRKFADQYRDQERIVMFFRGKKMQLQSESSLVRVIIQYFPSIFPGRYSYSFLVRSPVSSKTSPVKKRIRN